MRKYLVKRLLLSVVILFFVTFIIYLLMRCMPSSYVENMARQLSQAPGSKPYEEWLAQLNAQYGLDLGLIPGFFVQLKNLCTGNFGDSLAETFLTVAKRFTYGGDTGKDQRVYYINTKELGEILYGTATPIPFRVVVSEERGYKLSVNLRCNGSFTCRICDPLLFYTNVCSNVSTQYDASEIAPRLKSELMNALQPALATLSANKVQYYEIPAHTLEISEALNEQLSSVWRKKRGIEVFSFNINSLSIPEEQQKKITEWEENAMTTDPTTAAARLVGGQIDAMKTAAGNTAGAMTGFMGMGMAAGAGGMGGMSAQNLFAMGQQARPDSVDAPQQVSRPAPAPADSWQCSCGATVTGKFCPECGSKKPEPKPAADSWTCSCGATVTGKFCPECGKPRPAAAEGWKCSCGAVNKGKFCSECGAKKPEGAPLYKCDKCGLEVCLESCLCPCLTNRHRFPDDHHCKPRPTPSRFFDAFFTRRRKAG